MWKSLTIKLPEYCAIKFPSRFSWRLIRAFDWRILPVTPKWRWLPTHRKTSTRKAILRASRSHVQLLIWNSTSVSHTAETFACKMRHFNQVLRDGEEKIWRILFYWKRNAQLVLTTLDNIESNCVLHSKWFLVLIKGVRMVVMSHLRWPN